MSSSSPPRLTLIVAATASNGIGRNGGLPWRLPNEMKYFARTTTGTGQNAVVMGRKSWESIPNKFRPLKDRINVVISRSKEVEGVSEAKDTYLASSLEDALALLTRVKKTAEGKVFIIGGAQIYKQALELPAADRILLTRVKTPDYECDTFLPALAESEWAKTSHRELCEYIGFEAPNGDQEEKGTAYEFQLLKRQ